MDGSKPRQINFRLPEADAQRLDMLAAADHRSTPDYVRSVILSQCFPGEAALTGYPAQVMVEAEQIRRKLKRGTQEIAATVASGLPQEVAGRPRPVLPASHREVRTFPKGGKS